MTEPADLRRSVRPLAVPDRKLGDLEIELRGSEEKFKFQFSGSESTYSYTGVYEGIIPMLQRRHHESDNDDIREEIERFMTPKDCPDCAGRRLKPEALAVTVSDRPIDKVVELQLKEAEDFFKTIRLSEREETINQAVRHMTENAITIGAFYQPYNAAVNNRLVNVTTSSTFAHGWDAHVWDMN